MSIDDVFGPARSPGSREAQHAEGMHLVAQVLRDHPLAPIDTSEVRNQISAALDAVATELRKGRSVPTGIQRATLDLAKALHAALDPSGLSDP